MPAKMAPKGFERFQQFTPEQMQLFQQMFSHVGPDSYLSKLASGDQSAFEEMERPAMKQFQGLQGQTASRFSGLGGAGSLGARRSSGFGLEQNQASQDFAEKLQSNRLNMRNQALSGLMDMSNQLLGQQPYGLVEKQKKTPWWQSLIGGIGSGIGGAAGMGIGGAIGGGISNMFKNKNSSGSDNWSSQGQGWNQVGGP